ncbi:outer membrane lipoprotein carrier protein LolA [Flavobacterium sp.]|jgi:outer membrane lipoprotein-sorting protein|uniref:outer membrane lipoprotein carrier protein LolA n=1 Tax=Flavobacterium sp. TaxID=239 RepID=UPI0037C16216
MKQLFSIFLISFIACTLQAQDAKKAKELLDQVSAKVKSYDNIVIDFKYSLNNPKERINQESNGNVALKGNLYHLNFMGVTKIFDGKKVFTVVPEDEEVTQENFDANDEKAVTPNKMLTFFNTGYKYAWDIPQNVKGRKIQFVKLTPNSAKDTRKEVLVGIDTQTKHIYTVIEVGKNGTKTTLTVNSFKTNQPLSKNHFTFTKSKYPNYYINKLD